MARVSSAFASILILTTILVVSGLFAPAIAQSSQQEIIIVDANGTARASAMVDTDGTVEAALQDSTGSPANGVTVQLRNVDTGETLTALSKNGVATFSNLTPGVWEISSSVDWVVFSNVLVSAKPVGAWFAPAMAQPLFPAAAVAALGTAAVIANNDSDSSSTPTPQPTSGPDPDPTVEPTPAPTNNPRPRPTPQPTNTHKPTPTPTPMEPSPYL